MRKIKVLLMAMIVFGMAGGLVAFKAKGSVKYCTTATLNNLCPPKVCGWCSSTG